MEYKYDPILCMNVPVSKAADEKKAYSVGYKYNGVYQSIGVMASSEQEAIRKATEHFQKRGKESAEIYGAKIGESLETMKMKGKPVIDNDPIKDPDDCPKGMTCDGLFKKGDKFINKYKVVVEIVGFAKNDLIKYTVGRDVRYSTEKGLQDMLNANGYRKYNSTLDEAIRSCDSGVQYKGFEIVNAGSYYFIRGVNAFKFPTIEEAKEWIDEKESQVKKSGWR